jgi:hypothetical protein
MNVTENKFNKKGTKGKVIFPCRSIYLLSTHTSIPVPLLNVIFLRERNIPQFPSGLCGKNRKRVGGDISAPFILCSPQQPEPFLYFYVFTRPKEETFRNRMVANVEIGGEGRGWRE